MPFQLEACEKTFDDNEVPKYQNTYQMESQCSFKIDSVDRIVTSMMNDYLENITCDDEERVKVCRDIASEIRWRVKKLKFDRHKIVVIVTIIEKNSQSIEISFGCLWDSKRDNYSTFSLEGRTFYAHCCVFGIYYE